MDAALTEFTIRYTTCGECGGKLKASSDSWMSYRADIDRLIDRLGKSVLLCDCSECVLKTVLIGNPDIHNLLQYTMTLTVFVNEWLMREEVGAMWTSHMQDSTIWVRQRIDHNAWRKAMRDAAVLPSAYFNSP